MAELNLSNTNLAQAATTLANNIGIPKNILIPVSVNLASRILNINNHSYQYQVVNASSELLKEGASFVLNLQPQSINGQINPAFKQIIILGEPFNLKLPTEFIELARKNGISPQQLLTLAQRPQGYPLPLLEVKENKMIFQNGLSVDLTKNFSAKGEFKATIVATNNELTIKLTPVLNKLTLSLSGVPKNTYPSFENIVKTKSDIGQLYGQLLQLKIDASLSKVENPANLLQKSLFNIFSKITPSLATDVTNNTVDILTKKLVTLAPNSLDKLAAPILLKEELFNLAQMNPVRVLPTHEPFNSHSNAITGLFQLLLGVKFGRQTPELRNYLDMQKEVNNLDTRQLQQLDKSSALEKISSLLSNLSLYQHATSEHNATNPNSNVWFFALPYQLNNKNELFEGKYEAATKEQEDEGIGWQMQLKFNLDLAPLLVKVQMRNNRLSLNFVSNNQLLLDKAANKFVSFSDKLVQLGFYTPELKTSIEQVPATLLPGDHYLVKIKV